MISMLSSISKYVCMYCTCMYIPEQSTHVYTSTYLSTYCRVCTVHVHPVSVLDSSSSNMSLSRISGLLVRGSKITLQTKSQVISSTFWTNEPIKCFGGAAIIFTGWGGKRISQAYRAIYLSIYISIYSVCTSVDQLQLDFWSGGGGQVQIYTHNYVYIYIPIINY